MDVRIDSFSVSQASDMEHIHDIAVKSTENVKGGNEEIREVRPANLLVCILLNCRGVSL